MIGSFSAEYQDASYRKRNEIGTPDPSDNTQDAMVVNKWVQKNKGNWFVSLRDLAALWPYCEQLNSSALRRLRPPKCIFYVLAA